MSWLGDLTDWVGSAFDSSGGDSGGTVVPNSDPGQKGDGFFSSTAFYNSLLNAGLGLAGTYFKLSGDKKLAEQAAKARLAEIEAAKKGGGGGGGGAGAALAIARMNNLAQLYESYAALTEKGGEAAAAAAQQGGKMMQDPLIARLGVLR